MKQFPRLLAGRQERSGLSSLELIVAAGLMTTIVASTIPVYIRHQRLLVDASRERIALEELANQAERLQATPAADWNASVVDMRPSPIAVSHLPGVSLHADLDQTSLGPRVLLHLSWNAPGRRHHPLTLAVWRPLPDDNGTTQ